MAPESGGTALDTSRNLPSQVATRPPNHNNSSASTQRAWAAFPKILVPTSTCPRSACRDVQPGTHRRGPPESVGGDSDCSTSVLAIQYKPFFGVDT
jgi:hypothetical protein